MNKMYYLYIFLIIYNNSSILKASIGCMDHSFHMTKPCDRKELHYKRCNCPCRKIIDQKGLCLYCGHIGDPTRSEFNGMNDLGVVFR